MYVVCWNMHSRQRGVVCDGLWLAATLVRPREEVSLVGRVGEMREM